MEPTTANRRRKEKGRDSDEAGVSHVAANVAQFFDTQPPHDLESERALLGSMMLIERGPERSMMYASIRQMVRPKSFYSTDNEIIFKTLCAMHDDDRPIDAVLLREELIKRGLFADVGGIDYLTTLLNTVPSAANWKAYAKAVMDLSKRRAAVRIGYELAHRMILPMGDVDPDDLLRRATDSLGKIILHGSGLEFWRVGDAALELIDSRERGESDALDCGVPGIDETFRGLFTRGGYTLLAGRPSMGKSTAMRWLASQFAENGLRVGQIHIEERKRKVAGNYLSAYSGLENQHVAYGNLGPEEYRELVDAAKRLGRLPMWSIDTALSWSEVMAAFEILATVYRCDVIGIDHLHLLSDPEKAWQENRHREISRISESFKNAIKRANVVGLVCCQLSRYAGGKENPGPPTLENLRESGSLEEHADSVILLHRDDYYMGRDPAYVPNHQCRFLFPKVRNGQTGEVTLKAELRYQRFRELTALEAMESQVPEFPGEE